MLTDVVVPVSGPYPLAPMHMHTEPVRRYYVEQIISDEELADGPRVMAMIDRQRDELKRRLELAHRVMVGGIQYEQHYDRMHGHTRSLMWCDCIRDPQWVADMLAEVRAAVAADQQWLAEQRR